MEHTKPYTPFLILIVRARFTVLYQFIVHPDLQFISPKGFTLHETRYCKLYSTEKEQDGREREMDLVHLQHFRSN